MRRLAAWVVDLAPCLVALFGVFPTLSGLYIELDEKRRGVGLFDPRTGVDPVLLAHAQYAARLPAEALAVALAWLVIEALAARRGSVGQRLWAVQTRASVAQRLSRATLAPLVTVLIVASAMVATRRQLSRPFGYELYVPRRYRK